MAGNLIRIGKEISVEEIYEWVLSFVNETSHKRFEENVKFVFKLVFRHLRTNFYKDNLADSNIKINENEFYSYYFEDVSTELGVPLSEFYDPLNHKTQHRTLSNEYLRLLFTSKKFKQQFMSYITSGKLICDYQESIPNKILKILKRFDKLFDCNNLNNNDRVLNDIRKYFRTNKQCKLPWTKNEVLSAIETLKQTCK